MIKSSEISILKLTSMKMNLDKVFLPHWKLEIIHQLILKHLANSSQWVEFPVQRILMILVVD